MLLLVGGVAQVLANHGASWRGAYIHATHRDRNPECHPPVRDVAHTRAVRKW